MNLKIYNNTCIGEIRQEWGHVLQTLDIYYQPEFLVCEEEMQKGNFEIAIISNNTNYWIYPYIKLPIPNSSYYDISSPYGYAGPVCSDSDFGFQAELFFIEYIQNQQDVITEFVRYHYLYNQNYLFKQGILNSINRKIIVLNTQNSIDIFNDQFSGTNRNLVRKLEREGYEFTEKKFTMTDVDDFSLAYHLNMKHTNATDFYFFDNSFYTNLIHQLDEKIRIAKVEKDNIVYATALFFVSGDIITYFLSARNLDFSKVPGSNLLLSKMSIWAQQNNYKMFNFGGGLSLSEDDFLYKFKRNFSKDLFDFKIGKRIHQPEIYKELIKQYKQQHGEEGFEKRSNILQFYR